MPTQITCWCNCFGHRRSRIGNRLEADWKQIGNKLETNWKRIGNEVETNWRARSGIKLVKRFYQLRHKTIDTKELKEIVQ